MEGMALGEPRGWGGGCVCLASCSTHFPSVKVCPTESPALGCIPGHLTTARGTTSSSGKTVCHSGPDVERTEVAEGGRRLVLTQAEHWPLCTSGHTC